MIRKTVIIAMICLMGMFTLIGCGDSSSDEPVATEPATTEEVTTEETTEAQGDEAEFIKRISGLWLNGCQNAADAKSTAKSVGCTDVSMTEFKVIDGICYMSTYGDIKGEFDGDKVPDVNTTPIMFTEISPDYKTARGDVGNDEIEFDMGAPNDQVLYYKCAGYYTHCAYTGFSTFKEMDSYLMGN